MSRSYRKNPILTDGSARNTHQSKKLISRRLRRHLNNSDELLQGSRYKKHSESWEIHDYKSRWSWPQARIDFESDCSKYSWFKDKFKTIDDYYNWWKKNYYYK